MDEHHNVIQESECKYNLRWWLWYQGNSGVWGIFVKDWIRIVCLLGVLYGCLGLFNWAMLHAMHNVRRNEWQSVPNEEHFGSDFVQGVLGNRSASTMAGEVALGRLAADATGFFNIPKSVGDVGARTYDTGHGNLFPWVVAEYEAASSACTNISEAGAEPANCTNFIAA